MVDRLTLAVAGSGKTQNLAEYCAEIERHRRLLAVTFTKANQVELQLRISELAGDHPNIHVSGWYAFLLRDFARPFLPFKFRNRRIRGFNFEGRPHRYAKRDARFLDAEGSAYACELGRLATELIDASAGSLRRRIECCYDEILIDEIQDLDAYDWEILDFLLASSISIIMVGDFRQRVLSTNPRSYKNKQFAHTAAIQWFREREAKGLLSIKTSPITWRCRPEIAEFSDSIHNSAEEFPRTVSRNDKATGHDGVFWVHPCDVGDYVNRFEPQCLRDSVRSGTSLDLDYMNFGVAKGTSYPRVLIVPTGAIKRFIQKGEELVPTSAAKFYVAVTRAAQSVGIVLDGPGESSLPRWTSESSQEALSDSCASYRTDPRTSASPLPHRL